jgi:hypothetical protein
MHRLYLEHFPFLPVLGSTENCMRIHALEPMSAGTNHFELPGEFDPINPCPDLKPVERRAFKPLLDCLLSCDLCGCPFVIVRFPLWKILAAKDYRHQVSPPPEPCLPLIQHWTIHECHWVNGLRTTIDAQELRKKSMVQIRGTKYLDR